MFDFDQLEGRADDNQLSESQSNAAQDVEAGQKCRKNIGDRAADELFGQLLRLHRPFEYALYVDANDGSFSNGKLTEEHQTLQDGSVQGVVAKGAQPQQECQSLESGEVQQVEKELQMELPTTSNVSIPSDASGPVLQRNETAEEEKSSTIADTEEMEAAKLHDIIFASADARQKATEARWSETIDDDSGDEALGVLSSLSRSMGTWASIAYIGFSFTMSSDPMVAGQQIANLCRSRGGIYVKAAQTASAMEFAFPKEVLEEFQSLQDSADPQSWSEVEPRVNKNTPGGISMIYEEFSPEPINAASIAQVHVARRKTGQTVAVKILRRSLAQTFDRDVGDYLGLLGMYEAATGTPVKWMMEWAMEELKKELDFRWEAEQQEDCARFVKSRMELRDRLTVPLLHSELCSKRLLVMEYIDGCKITKAPEHFQDWDYARDVPAIHEALETWHAMQLFLTGKFHGDPHPGNVLIRRSGTPHKSSPFEVVVIDHGGYYSLDDETRKLYAEVWSMMDEPKDDKQKAARRIRLKEIMSSWGIGHTSRFVIEQMFNGHFGAADPTASIPENGEARRHRWNWMHQKRDDLGPPVFEEVSKMPPALMKAFGVGNFTRSAWSILSKGQKELRGWDFCKARVKIMIHWARKCPGARSPP